MSKELLQRLPLFSGLSEPELDRLLAMSETIAIHSGDVLIREGEPGDALYVVLDGELEVTKRSGQSTVVVNVCRPGDMIGETALLEQSLRTATVRAVTESHLIRIGQSAFARLTANPQSLMVMLRTVTSRLRSTEAMLGQSEKMAALGTLAAGLAHELNNPAAAIKRSSAQLGAAIMAWEQATAALVGLHLTAEQMRLVDQLRQRIASPATAGNLDPLARSDQEGELQLWLEDLGIDEAWDLAPTLVSAGWPVPTLLDHLQGFDSAQQACIARWLAAGCTVQSLLYDVGVGSERISAIVGAVKSYSFLDQAPIQEVDLHEGIDNTLIILHHKLKEGVTVQKEYAPNLPRIEAYGGELNQVWTNIIDNAIDAMKGQGAIVIRTGSAERTVTVDICDNGPGIPLEIQKRIFEPFFTTKPPGTGTGLGLHISYNIVRKHRGEITVTSQPGATCFHVTLPTQMTKEARQ